MTDELFMAVMTAVAFVSYGSLIVYLLVWATKKIRNYLDR